VGVSLVFVLRTLAVMWIVGRQDAVSLSEFLRPLTRPLAACVVMAAGVTAARVAFADLSPPMRLLVEIAAGSLIYVGAALLVARPLCGELVRVVRAALNLPERRPAHLTPRVLSLSTEFPNPSERGKGLFVRSRLEAIAARSELFVVAPVAALDYANPQRRLFDAWRIPRARREGGLQVFHPRWLYPPFGGWTNAFFLFARLLPAVGWLRARRRFGVIDAHFAHPEGIAAVLLGRILGSRVFVTIRGSELRYRRQPWKRFWMAWALKRADRVIAVSDNLRELAVDLGADPQRVKTIPNGINGGIFFRQDGLACRSRHEIAFADRIILCAGDLAELKGHHRVIAAVKALNDRGVRARLLVAGGVGRSGRYAETLRRQVVNLGLDDQVTWLGEVTQQTLAELMSAADVFCLASSTEGWPNVVNEALACGTPVVATDVGAVRQMVMSDRYGYVVPVEDVEALANALLSALSRRWDHEAISALGRSRSWDRVAEEVLDEIRAVMTERRGTASDRAVQVPAGSVEAALGTPELTAARMERS
jgi:glycosyltransferase involved in cell wall biosynthesis